MTRHLGHHGHHGHHGHLVLQGLVTQHGSAHILAHGKHAFPQLRPDPLVSQSGQVTVASYHPAQINMSTQANGKDPVRGDRYKSRSAFILFRISTA